MNVWGMKFWGLLMGFFLSIAASAILSNLDYYWWSVALIIIATIFLILWTEHYFHNQFPTGRGRK